MSHVQFDFDFIFRDEQVVHASNVRLFMQYHSMYSNHGHRWLNAKIRPDTGVYISLMAAPIDAENMPKL